VKLIDTSNWSDFTYLSDQERMLNVRKKIEHNVVMNVKRLIDKILGKKVEIKIACAKRTGCYLVNNNSSNFHCGGENKHHISATP
jgi:hypothetical protein